MDLDDLVRKMYANYLNFCQLLGEFLASWVIWLQFYLSLVLALEIEVNESTDRAPIYILRRFESARHLIEEMTEVWCIAIKTMTDADNERKCPPSVNPARIILKLSIIHTNQAQPNVNLQGNNVQRVDGQVRNA